MDWFERLTGLEPDGGNGTFEVYLIVVLGLITMTISIYGWRKLRRGERSD